MAEPFWASEEERLTYEHAVEANPKYPAEAPLQYIARIADIAQGRMGRIVEATDARKARIKALAAQVTGREIGVIE